jgi:hypothetical protein
MFGPPLLLRLVLGRQDERTRLVKKLAQVGLPVALLAGWYFWRNWPYLHYYYFVWGADPTAGLPLSQSIQHFHRALWNLGYGLFFVAVVILVLNLWFGLQSPRGLGLSTSLLWRVDWKLLYMAIAPPAFLALNGAGLNPFVAMPAIFGFLCFCLFPLRGKVGAGVPSVVKVLICAGLAAFSVHNVRQGHSSHVMPQPHFATMASVTQGIVQMFDDTRRRNKRELNFTTSHLADFQASMIRNVLYFEFAGEFVRHAIRVQDLTVRATHEHLFSPAVPISWHEIAGRTDEEKYSTLVQVALADLDYIFLPDEPTLDFLEKHKRHNFINVKVRGLKRRLLATGRWKQVGEPIRATPNETVVLYGKAMVGAQNRSTVSHTTGTTCQAPAGSLVS